MRLAPLVMAIGAGTLLAQSPLVDINGTPQAMPSLQLSWIDRNGRSNTVGAPGPYLGIEVSADGKRIAAHRHEGAGGDIWVIEEDGRQTRITFEPSRDNASPVWSPDGRRIAYAAWHEGRWGLYHSASNGTGGEELLFESDEVKAPLSWTPDGKRLVFYVRSSEKAGDLWVLTLAGSAKPAPLIATRANEWNAQVSPDGKWIAFTSDIAGGRDEVYVQSFPSGGDQFRISRNGGAWPRWRKDGEELYYRADPHTWDGSSLAVPAAIIAVPVSVKKQIFATGRAAAIRPVFALAVHHIGGGSYHSYDMAPDGKRILNFLAPAPPANDRLKNRLAETPFRNVSRI